MADSIKPTLDYHTPDPPPARSALRNALGNIFAVLQIFVVCLIAFALIMIGLAVSLRIFVP